MADFNTRGPCDDDCEGERGERGERGEKGERGERGHRGHRGRRGRDGRDATPIVHDGSLVGEGTGLSPLALNAQTDGSLQGVGTAASPLGINPANVLNQVGPFLALNTIVFRPGDPAGSRLNVFVTWAETYAALQAVAEQGIVYLEFDPRFSPTVEPSTGQRSCVIPAGVWNMNNVHWTNTLITAGPQGGAAPRVFVELADGAQIVFTAPFNTLRIVGWNLVVFSNRTGPVAPFTDIHIVLDGTRTQLRNTLLVPGALPIWEITAGNARFLVISGSNSQGGLGGGGTSGNPASVSPVVSIAAGATLAVLGGAGFVKNNALTGSGDVNFLIKDDNFNGASNNNEDFIFPAFTGFMFTETEHRDRWFGEVGFVVTAADLPFQAFLNELVKVDTTAGPVTIDAPSANVYGERFSVIDYTGNAAVTPITIASTFGDTVDSAVINVAGQCKTWVSDGAGRWMLHSSSTP